MLLHGWTASADLNFYTCYEALGEHFRVLAFDHRGHGHGIRSRRRFRLEDCADDVAELLAVVDVDPAIAVGYSMGGAVAQLLWRRHPEGVRGLVLAATAAQFKARYNERLSFLGLRGLARLARLTPAQVRMFLSNQLYLGAAHRGLGAVGRRGGVQRTTGGWSSRPAARSDRSGRRHGSARSTCRRRSSSRCRTRSCRCAARSSCSRSIPGARAFRVDAGHDAVVARPDRAVPVLVAACQSLLVPA